MQLDKYLDFFESLKKNINPEKEPGFSSAIVKNGKVIYALNHGLASIEHESPLTSDSLYYLASVSKQFTAACVLNLVNDKRLRLNQDVREIVKETRHFSNKITIQNLLNHTSGIPDYFEYLNCQPGLRGNDYFENSDILKIVDNLDGLRFPPNEYFRYSNSNYILLAEVVKRVSGSRPSIYAKKNIFSPVGMKCTIFDDDRNKVIKKRVSSYTSPSARSRKYYAFLKNSCTVGDGGVLSSINDLIKWEINFHNNENLPAKVINGLAKRGQLSGGKPIDYGNGLELSATKSKIKFNYHGGSFEGFQTYILRVPSLKTSFIYLSNNEYLSDDVVWPHRNRDLIAYRT